MVGMLLLAFVVFILILFIKKNIFYATISYFGIIMSYILLDYQVIFNAIKFGDYKLYLSFILLIVLINVMKYYFNKYFITEIGHNTTNLLSDLLPTYELKYLTLFFITIFTITPYFIIQAFCAFIISRFLKLSKLYSFIVILIGLFVNNIVMLTMNPNYLFLNINPSVILLIAIIVVVAFIYILSILSTNYNYEDTLKDMVKSNSMYIWVILLVFVVSFMVFNEILIIRQAIYGASSLTIIIIIEIGNKIKKKTDKDIEYIDDIQNRYPFLYSIVILLINFLIIMVPNYLHLETNIVLIIQIASLLMFNSLIFYFMKLKPITDDDHIPKDYVEDKYISVAKNMQMLSLFTMVFIINSFVSYSILNVNNTNVSILMSVGETLGNLTDPIEVLLYSFSIMPILPGVESLISMNLTESVLIFTSIAQSLFVIISPFFLSLIYIISDGKEKRIIEVYKYVLIFLLLISVIYIFIIKI